MDTDLRRALGVLAAVLAAAVVAFALVVPNARATTLGFEIIIPIDTVETGDEDSEIPLASVNVPVEFVGQECDVSAVSRNQGSVHPGNDLVVASGGSSVLLPDVEGVPGGTVEANEKLVLGSTVTVTLIMGPDEFFSAGIDVIVDCTPPPTTTTVAPTTTLAPETTSTTVEILPTSITAAPSTTVEVEPSETLPFTGSDGGTPALLALALIGIGLLALVATRRTEDV